MFPRSRIRVYRRTFMRFVDNAYILPLSWHFATMFPRLKLCLGRLPVDNKGRLMLVYP